MIQTGVFFAVAIVNPPFRYKKYTYTGVGGCDILFLRGKTYHHLMCCIVFLIAPVLPASGLSFFIKHSRDLA